MEGSDADVKDMSSEEPESEAEFWTTTGPRQLADVLEQQSDMVWYFDVWW
jgi:hypothetical protein